MRNYKSKNTGQYLTQAERIIERFGGARRLAEALSAVGEFRHPSVVYKWTYPKDRGGTGGLIPTAAWPDILKAARHFGIYMTEEDTDPRPRVLKRGNHVI